MAGSSGLGRGRWWCLRPGGVVVRVGWTGRGGGRRLLLLFLLLGRRMVREEEAAVEVRRRRTVEGQIGLSLLAKLDSWFVACMHMTYSTWSAGHLPRRWPYPCRCWAAGPSCGAHTARPSSPGLRGSSRRCAGTPRCWSAAPGRRSRPSPSRRAAARQTSSSSSSCAGRRARASAPPSHRCTRLLLWLPSQRAYCEVVQVRLWLEPLVRVPPQGLVLLLELLGSWPWV